MIRILMQSVPLDIDITDITTQLELIDKVKHVHHLHVWEIDEHNRSLEAHVVISEADHKDAEIIKKQIKNVLEKSFRITHSTIEFEYGEQTKHDTCNDKSVISPH